MRAGRACQRFSRLSSEAEDRDLKPSEHRFLEAHREACPECRETETVAACALNMLRDMSFDDDIEISPTFDERIIRRLKVNTVREGIRYWSPAAVGAGIACVALFAALHVAATPTQMKDADVPGGQVRNSTPRNYPNLELDRIPEFRR
ncbi:MAG: zf-HC2 domain-containing protein [Fimbriimonas sp.]